MSTPVEPCAVPIPDRLKNYRPQALTLLVCERCPQQFWRPPSQVAAARFCSISCRNAERTERGRESNGSYIHDYLA